MNITKKDLSFITITEILLIIKTNLGVYRFMPIWHQSPKLTPRYFLETPRLFGYPGNLNTCSPSFVTKYFPRAIYST